MAFIFLKACETKQNREYTTDTIKLEIFTIWLIIEKDPRLNPSSAGRLRLSEGDGQEMGADIVHT